MPMQLTAARVEVLTGGTTTQVTAARIETLAGGTGPAVTAARIEVAAGLPNMTATAVRLEALTRTAFLLTGARAEVVAGVTATQVTAARIEAMVGAPSTIVSAARAEALTGAHRTGLTAARIEVLTAPKEVDLTSCAGKPASYFIMPDLLLTGASNVESVTTQQGPYPGTPSAQDANMGRLLPLQSGRLTTNAADVTYQIREAGGVGVAEWVWKDRADAATRFRGTDDPQRFRYWHAAITSSVPGSDNCATVYASTHNRLLCFGIDPTTNIVTIAYRDPDVTRYDEWATTTFTLDAPIRPGEHGAAAIELPDGKLLLAVKVERTGTASADFDMYQSADGGLTWARTAKQVLDRAGISGLIDIDDRSQCRMARAGEHIRLCWVDGTTGPPVEIYSAYSTDRGATWTVLADVWETNTVSGADDPFPFSLVGVDDAGLFLLNGTLALAPNNITFRVARADGDWATPAGAPSTLGITLLAPVRQIVSVKTASFIYVWAYTSDLAASDQDGWALSRVPIAEVGTTAPLDWQATDRTAQFTGALYEPSRVAAAWTGSEVWFWGARKAEATGTDITLGLGWYWGGWTERSLGSISPSMPLLNADTVWTGVWHIGQGQPSQGGGSPWVQATVGTGTDALNMDYMDVTGTAVGDARSYTLTSAPAAGWLAGSAFDWVVRLDTGDSTTAADNVAVRLVAEDGGAASVDVSLRIGPAGIDVFDNEAAVSLATLAITMDTGAAGAFTEIRFWIDQDAAPVARCQLLAYDTGTRTWVQTAVLILTRKTVGPASASSIEFGHLGQAQATQMRSWWREFAYKRDTTANQGGPEDSGTGFVNPGDLFGWVASANAVAVQHGLTVAWGGSGGVIGDGFLGGIRYQHPVAAVALGSPRLDYRSEPPTSGPLTTTTIILDADPVNGLHRWEHNAVAMFGINCRNILIDYDTTAGFGAPTATETLDATAFASTVATIGSIAGTAIRVSSSVPWIAGECAGLYIRMTSGAAVGLTFRVTAHRSSNILHCGDETVALVTQGVASSDTFVMFRESAALEYVTPIGDASTLSKRYMRIRFEETDTAEGDHRLGTLVVGRKLQISVPLDWAMTDNQQPNVTKYRTRSAVSWRFKEGPLQRTLVGRLVGDANRFRDRLRFVLGQLDFENHVSVLVLDDESPDLPVLGRLVSGSQHDNAAWYRDSTGILRTAGDQSITFEEEV